MWQERFSSFVMDEQYPMVCVRYIENNPVRAKLVRSPELWPWSSASAHMRNKDDALVRVAPALSMLCGDWRKFLSSAMSTGEIEDFRRHERTGRPLGGKSFVEQLERSPGRKLAPQKPGRKSKK